MLAGVSRGASQVTLDDGMPTFVTILRLFHDLSCIWAYAHLPRRDVCARAQAADTDDTDGLPRSLGHDGAMCELRTCIHGGSLSYHSLELAFFFGYIAEAPFAPWKRCTNKSDDITDV